MNSSVKLIIRKGKFSKDGNHTIFSENISKLTESKRLQ